MGKKHTIPVPPAPIPLPDEDSRKEALNAWKKLFEDVDSSIQVLHEYDQGFSKAVEEALRYLHVRHFYGKVSILVKLDLEKTGVECLFGGPYDRMFSNEDVEEDLRNIAANNLPDNIEPVTKSFIAIVLFFVCN